MKFLFQKKNNKIINRKSYQRNYKECAVLG